MNRVQSQVFLLKITFYQLLKNKNQKKRETMAVRNEPVMNQRWQRLGVGSDRAWDQQWQRLRADGESLRLAVTELETSDDST